MSKRILWIMVSSLMALSLVMAACGPAATPTTPTTPTTPNTPTTPTTPAKPAEEPTQKEAVKPVAEVPKYGGILIIIGAEITNNDPFTKIMGDALTSQELIMGDWAKGIAGGYGTSETDFRMASDLPDIKKGFLAESAKWTIDEAKNEGTIVCQIRQGIHFALNPKSEASRLVNGREMTVDDVVYTFKRRITDSKSYIVLSNPELKAAQITKTGPREVAIKVPIPALMSAITRFTDSTEIVAPEVVEKYGDLVNWRNSVGLGAFMLTDYVPGSQIVYVRNPNYWDKDPVGPSKGNQLPYLDVVTKLILPDFSTRQAALRTGKLDSLENLSFEDANQFRKTVPALQEAYITSWEGRGSVIKMPVDRAPFNDIRVRRAMFMATDLETIHKNLFSGKAQYVVVMFSDTKDYHDIYLGPDDPDMPASGKELYNYSPEKARQLLKEAGYPNGFKTSILIPANTQFSGGVNYIDYYSVIKDMWAKVGIELNLDVREPTVVNNIKRARTMEALTESAAQPVATFYLGINVQGTSEYNTGMLDDPVLNKAMDKVRTAALTDLHEAMRIFKKEVSAYCYEQCYVIPNVYGYRYTMWWPWLKGYSGEVNVGYMNAIWPYYIWYDQDLKKSMGY